MVVHNFLKADLEDDEEEVEVSLVWKALNRINSTKLELPISAIFSNADQLASYLSLKS